MRNIFPKALFPTLILILSVSLPAHYSWIIPNRQKGLVEIGHGHDFPVSMQAMNVKRIHVTLIDDRGKPFAVDAENDTTRLTASIPPELKVLTAAIFVENPLILNRTPQGVKTGPMYAFKDVADSFRRHRSGTFQSAPGIHIPSAENQLVLLCHRDRGRTYLSCKLGDSIVEGVRIEVIDPGSKSERAIGETDNTGRRDFTALKSGFHLFSAHWSRSSADTDTRRDEYSTTLAVMIE